MTSPRIFTQSDFDFVDSFRVSFSVDKFVIYKKADAEFRKNRNTIIGSNILVHTPKESAAIKELYLRMTNEWTIPEDVQVTMEDFILNKDYDVEIANPDLARQYQLFNSRQ
jgi:putative transposon-encoded protein